MSKHSQQRKAKDLLRLHANGGLLVLPDVWNPIGARILAAKGYPAAATASAALSASMGYADGERIQRSTLIEFLGRIARSVEVPVTADIEAGYAGTPAELEETVRQVIGSGVVGINIEDSLEEGGALRSVTEQAARIAHLRRVADKLDLPLVINARIDCFLSALFADKSRAVEETVARAKAYSEAEAMAWGHDVSRYSLSYDPTGDLHATLERVEYLTAACEQYGLDPLTTPVLARLEMDDMRSFEKRT